jgi:hypothetical protein
VPGIPRAIRLVRRPTAVRISWGADHSADTYLVIASLSDGRRVTYQASARHRVVTLPAVSPSTTGRITLIGVGPLGNESKRAVVALAAAPRPGRATGVRARRTRRGVLINWRPAKGAAVYIVTVEVTGRRAPMLEPDIVAKPSLFSTRTLPRLKPGTAARFTIVPLALTGQKGPATSFTYRSP